MEALGGVGAVSRSFAPRRGVSRLFRARGLCCLCGCSGSRRPGANEQPEEEHAESGDSATSGHATG